MACFLGIDIGTTGIKSLLIDDKGRTVASASVEHDVQSPHPGWTEQNPEVWWRGTLETVRQVVTKAGPGEQVGGIGLSGQMHTSVFLDRSGSVIRPAILWNDARTTEACRWITEKVGTENLKKTVGNPALEGFTAPKVVWLRDQEPENFEKLTYLLLPKDYIRYRLTGEMRMDFSDAAGTLMLDVRKREWSGEFLKKTGIPSGILPGLAESIEVCGQVTAEVAEATGLRAGTQVVAGGADNTCGAVGNGVVKPGRVLSSIGTSGVIFAHSDQMRVDPGMRVHSFCHSVPLKSYLMGVSLSAGSALKWYRDVLSPLERAEEAKSGTDAYELLTKAAATCSPGAEGLLFLPYLAGERTPHQDASARGVWFGLSHRHRREHLIRSVLEGITFALRDSLEIIKGLNVPVQDIRCAGGGARSPFWRQLQADIFGHPVTTMNSEEGPAFGAALMAAVGLGSYSSLEEATDEALTMGETLDPIKANSARYDQYYQRFQDLYPRLREPFAEMSQLVATDS